MSAAIPNDRHSQKRKRGCKQQRHITSVPNGDYQPKFAFPADSVQRKRSSTTHLARMPPQGVSQICVNYAG